MRAHARRLGLRTAAKPDSQDVCFIGRTEGRHRIPGRHAWSCTRPRWWTPTGSTVGTVDAVELVTVGQRRGMGHGGDGTRRYVTRVDVARRTVTVGSAAEALQTAVLLAGPTLTWVEAPLDARRPRHGPGERARPSGPVHAGP